MMVALCAVLAVLVIDPASARSANNSPLPPDAACAQIRDQVRKVAKAERNEALALHLLADGRATPMVQARLTELQAQIEDLRALLKRARTGAVGHESSVSDCIDLGAQSLTDAEKLTKQIKDVVMGEGELLGPPAQVRPGVKVVPQLPEPSLPPGRVHEE